MSAHQMRFFRDVSPAAQRVMAPALTAAQDQHSQLLSLKADILGYRRGIFASFMHQPMVQALLLALSAVGI